MVLLRALHPPAGAMTLIVSLVILKGAIPAGDPDSSCCPTDRAGIVINRLAGIAYPRWSAQAEQ
jgi:hypothetical protein